LSFHKWVETIECPLEDGSTLNLYLLMGERLVLIDSGIASTPEQYVFPYLRYINRAATDLSSAIITHAHVDHFGGIAALYSANPSISFFIHRDDWEWVEDRRKHVAELYGVYPGQWELPDTYRSELLRMCGNDVPVTNVLEDGDLVSNGEAAWTCLHTPAHSPGHIILHQPFLKAAICGDVIQQQGTVPDGVMVFPLYDQVNMYLESLRKIDCLQLETAATSHFGVLHDEEIGEAISVSRAFVSQHDETIMDVLDKARKPLTLREMVSRLQSLHYPRYELGFQIHATTHAHCQHLREQQVIERVLHEGQVMWALKGR
jgi:glyoxylase-like metal-dependent hydrolase (beta-lactamase superfamily II)